MPDANSMCFDECTCLIGGPGLLISVFSYPLSTKHEQWPTILVDYLSWALLYYVLLL